MTELDPIERRRRQREAARRRSLTLGILGGGVLVAVLLVAVVVAWGKKGIPEVPGVTAPSGSDSENWTHKDLAEYLAKKGVKVEIQLASDLGGRPASYFASGKNDTLDSVVPVVLCASKQDANGVAGSTGRRSFAWGRFAVVDVSDKARPLHDRIRVALTR